MSELWIHHRSGLIISLLLPLGLLICVGLGCVPPRNAGSSDPTSSKSSSPELKVLSKKGTIEYSFVTVEGQVQNISGASLEAVQAVVTHYDGNGSFVTSDSALIEYNPLLPGQTSPYKVLTRHNPAMKTFNVEFKHILGGEIYSIDASPDQKPPQKKKKK
ncbi:MAG: hypothetical protein IPO41_01435 [Acidobacteria bacterium]|nr:hypothetical protein [Acidobacteriota bacterium]MBP7475577.1 FxLYD domain-containing protein [Pyrinomonadaceae bacterium]MBP9110680.1 FxLYD domain-containing protein [Pyrinomonadaceae bacterium]